MADGEVAGANELAAMAGKAFQKSNDKKMKKQQRAEQAASGGPKKGFRRTAGGGGERAPRPPKIGDKKKAAAASGDIEDGDAEVEAEEEDKPQRRAAAAPTSGKRKGGGGKSDNKWTYIGLLLLICLGSLQVIIPVFESLFGGGGSARGGSSGSSAFNYPAVTHVKLDVSDTDAMRRVFFSGESWFVLCNNHTDADVPHTVFERAAAMLHHTRESAKSHPIFSATLPCHEHLVNSGKTIYERWDLPLPTTTLIELDSLRGVPRRSATMNRDGSEAGMLKHYVPTAFYVSNGDKPKAVAPSFFGYREKDDALTTTAHKLAELVRDSTKPRNYVTVTNTGHLTNYCTKKRHCALFLYESDDYKMPPAVREQINALCGTYRAVRCAAMDVVRYKSSLAKALPALLDDKAAPFPRLVLTKKLTEDELKKLADEEAAEAAKAPKPEADPEAAGSDSEANPSRTVNPKVKVLKSIGLQAKAHRGAWSVPALSTFIETVFGMSPAWHHPEEQPTRVTPTSYTASADDKKMTQLRDWPTMSARPYSELPKKKKTAAAPKKRAARKPSPNRKPAAAKPTDDAKADPADPKAQAKAEAEIRARMDQEEADRAPQAADESDDADANAAPAEDDEENIDLDDTGAADDDAAKPAADKPADAAAKSA